MSSSGLNSFLLLSNGSTVDYMTVKTTVIISAKLTYLFLGVTWATKPKFAFLSSSRYDVSNAATLVGY